MKRILLASLAATLFLGACKKDKDNKPVTVTVDGKQTTLNVESAMYSRFTEGGIRSLTVTAVSADQQSRFIIALYMAGAQGNNVDAKTYPVRRVAGKSFEATVYRMERTSNGAYVATNHVGTDGEIVITKGDNGAITGTFNFTLKDESGLTKLAPMVLQDGKFENVQFKLAN
ncbi:hypothetical protein HHL16_11695 [Pseudoflavitalea sp. G-6-1-2]|uniref:hypothetical protein n=1 Tax=Pseudoflavitalea sp. G-6-1-2 TaxID=2728841 RepID=UPI00146CF517|nr:hypothetical protein [Pseudoflavitalea sp. G-6-1-2]NML21542.1 hypothetical protein [Pseudoflavitalea sp. G-6-1-2]